MRGHIALLVLLHLLGVPLALLSGHQSLDTGPG
jgi:hypothetical protein